MSGTTEKVPGFKETILTDVIVRRIEYGHYHNLTWLFDEYPVFEVRKAILRHWLDHSIPVLAQDTDWVEQRIYDLGEEQAKTQSNSRLWEDLLGWYVFNTNTRYIFDDNTDLVSRALEFAIKLTQNDLGGMRSSFYRSDVLKVIAGRLERTPHIYESIKTPSLRLFLESFLEEKYLSKHDIIDYGMVDVRRVIRCAVAVEAWGFMPYIEKVLFKLRNQRKPERYDFGKEIEILESLAFLQEAVRLFEEKTKGQ